MSRLKLSGPALFVALLVSWPAIQHCVFDHTLSAESMLLRIGLAVLFSMAASACLSAVIDTYRLQNAVRRRREEARDAAGAPRRRTDDEPARSA